MSVTCVQMAHVRSTSSSSLRITVAAFAFGFGFGEFGRVFSCTAATFSPCMNRHFSPLLQCPRAKCTHGVLAISSLLMRLGDPVRFGDFDLPLPFPGVFVGFSCEKLQFLPLEHLPVFMNS